MNSQLRSRLNAILDILVPANPERGIPAAGAAGVAEFIDKARAEDPDTANALDDLLSHAASLSGDVTPELVRLLESARPHAFETLLRLTYMGYYSRADLRARVGVSALPVHPVGYAVVRETESELEALVAPVRARGPIYRSI